ncbi:MAG: hypothetical protein ACXWUP_10900 [Allosphingosinicella sp.]
MGHDGLIGILFLAMTFGGPLLLALAGWRRRSAAGDGGGAPAPSWDWPLSIRSSLLYALAFNLVFFIQELFLVVPKALTPGLRPTLYHNNHSWQGDHPLASLFQGTGALAILVTGLVFAALVKAGTGRTANARLFVVWMAYHGLFQSLPQLVVGAIAPGNDVGMAMDYLGLSTEAKSAIAVTAMVAIILAALWLTRPLLELVENERDVADSRARHRFIARIATIPAFLAIPLIIAFRVPRETVEVISPPIAVTLVGMLWIQANAWRVTGLRPRGASLFGSTLVPLALVVLLLLGFHLVLRPGIPFY